MRLLPLCSSRSASEGVRIRAIVFGLEVGLLNHAPPSTLCWTFKSVPAWPALVNQNNPNSGARNQAAGDGEESPPSRLKRFPWSDSATIESVDFTHGSADRRRTSKFAPITLIALIRHRAPLSAIRPFAHFALPRTARGPLLICLDSPCPRARIIIPPSSLCSLRSFVATPFFHFDHSDSVGFAAFPLAFGSNGSLTF